MSLWRINTISVPNHSLLSPVVTSFIKTYLQPGCSASALLSTLTRQPFFKNPNLYFAAHNLQQVHSRNLLWLGMWLGMYGEFNESEPAAVS
jgi:hypothetical protein